MKIGIVLVLILCAGASARVVEESEDFPATPLQLERLAEAVCHKLFTNSEQKVKCEEDFLSKKNNPKPTEKMSTPEIKSKTDDSITVAVTSSKFKQLITLLNDDNKNRTIIYFDIVQPNEEIVSLPIKPGNYTIWTTVLNDDGVPLSWRRGPFIEEKAKREKERIEERERKNRTNEFYDIKISQFAPIPVKDKFLVSVNVVWNSTEAADSFYVVNTCNKMTQGNFIFKTIKPYQERNVTLNNLPVNDTCMVTIQGHGITKKTYHTPPCEHRDCFSYRAKDLEMNATWDADNDSWLVRVAWQKPAYEPDSYRVTLATTDTMLNVQLPGNATGHHFENVSGEGHYDVLVEAVVGNTSEATSRRRTFPPMDPPRPVGLLLGAWSAALLVVATLLTAVLCWRRRLRLMHSKNYIYRGGLEVLEDDAECLAAGSEDQWEVRPERLLLHEVIGEGAFGVVRRGTLAPANKDVAVKMLKDFPSVEEIRSFRAEMELMKSVGAHSHVVSLVGCCSGRRPLIVAEYCSRGDLLSYLRCSWDIMISRRNAKYYNNNKESIDYRNDLFKNKSTDPKFAANRLYDLQGVCDTELTLLDLLSFCRQIAMGMEFLASNRVVHRDLAARNILVTSDRTLKIADFGLSRDIYQENQYKQKGNGKMPVKWMALESLTHRIYTTQSDVWSFGVVMWEVVTVGGSPYAGVSAERLPRLLAAGYRMPQPPNCSPALYKVMMSCWNERPRARPTFGELHGALDELLCVCADHYLSLAMPQDIAATEPHSKPYRYVRMLMRGRRKRGKSYERPLTAPTNHYTDQPLSLAPT